jgi:DNA-binding response OmpR family regulator
VTHSKTPSAPADTRLTATDLVARPLGGSRVLVLESDPDGCASLAAVLRLSGFDAVESHTGRDALRFVADAHPCAVVMDLSLPDADPWRLIRQFRAGPDAPAVVVVTGDTNPAHRAAALAAGACGYLLKPADPQVLVRLIDKLCHPG